MKKEDLFFVAVGNKNSCSSRNTLCFRAVIGQYCFMLSPWTTNHLPFRPHSHLLLYILQIVGVHSAYKCECVNHSLLMTPRMTPQKCQTTSALLLVAKACDVCLKYMQSSTLEPVLSRVGQPNGLKRLPRCNAPKTHKKKHKDAMLNVMLYKCECMTLEKRGRCYVALTPSLSQDDNTISVQLSPQDRN